MKIRDLEISARERNCLLNAGYEDFEEIVLKIDTDLLAIRNINNKCVEEIHRKIKEYKQVDSLKMN